MVKRSVKKSTRRNRKFGILGFDTGQQLKRTFLSDTDASANYYNEYKGKMNKINKSGLPPNLKLEKYVKKSEKYYPNRAIEVMNEYLKSTKNNSDSTIIDDSSLIGQTTTGIGQSSSFETKLQNLTTKFNTDNKNLQDDKLALNQELNTLKQYLSNIASMLGNEHIWTNDKGSKFFKLNYGQGNTRSYGRKRSKKSSRKIGKRSRRKSKKSRKFGHESKPSWAYVMDSYNSVSNPKTC